MCCLHPTTEVSADKEAAFVVINGPWTEALFYAKIANCVVASDWRLRGFITGLGWGSLTRLLWQIYSWTKFSLEYLNFYLDACYLRALLHFLAALLIYGKNWDKANWGRLSLIDFDLLLSTISWYISLVALVLLSFIWSRKGQQQLSNCVKPLDTRLDLNPVAWVQTHSQP